jgi:competence protein ComEC
MELFFFILGVMAYYTKPSLYILCIVLLWLKPTRLILYGMLYCCAYDLIFAPSIIPHQFLYDNKVSITGFVASIPKIKNNKQQFVFNIDHIGVHAISSRVLLSWYQANQEVSVGEYWQLQVKLKKPRNYSNPGGFDYKRQLALNNIMAVGYINKKAFRLKRAVPLVYKLAKFRASLASEIRGKIAHYKTKGILIALMLGIKEGISQNQWQLFRLTGTGHLMAISGLHVGLLASNTYLLFLFIWRLSPSLCKRIAAQKIGAIAAIFAAFSYALLAGFSLSTQRALIMCIVFFLRHFIFVWINAWQSWRIALILVLLLAPKSILMPGFYLSFSAVGILLFSNQFLISSNKLIHIIKLQCFCVIGLIPFTLYFFQYASLTSIFANLLAIPLVGLIIVPIAIIAMLVIKADIASYLLILDCTLIAYLITALKFFSSVNYFSFDGVIPSLTALIGFALSLIIISCVRKRELIFVALVMIIPLLYPSRTKIKNDTALIDVLDVGQGLAVLIRTKSHHLLYDTGTKFYKSYDMGELVILPYMRHIGLRQLDIVVVSHTDIDHRGGLNALLLKKAVRHLVVNVPDYYKKGVSCHQFKPWKWDGVSFEFLSLKRQFKKSNNTSCILKISNDKQAILLTGDIERKVERHLVNKFATKLESTVVIVPHHGSKTSSSIVFIEKVKPQFAFISAGFNNRFNLPHADIIKRYKQRGVRLYNTIDCGMISWTLRDSIKIDKPNCYRSNLNA